MPKMKLTKTAVDALKPRKKPWIMYDTEITGFGVRVGRSGRKVWIVEYRPGAGGRGVSTKRPKLGDTTVLTVEKARKAAKIALARARLGDDLADKREVDRDMPTINEYSKVFMKDHVEAKRKASTAKTYWGHLERMILPNIGSVKIHLLTTEEVTKLHLKIGRENGKGVANRMLITLSSMYGYLRRLKKFTGPNPAAGVERFPEGFQERFLNSEEVAAIGAALLQGETVGIPWRVDESKPTAKHIQKKNRFTIIDRFAAAAIRLLLLTGCRKGEILNLRWDQVDLERGLLFLPDSKTGKKQVILNSFALMILHDLPRVGPYVIPGKWPDRPRHDLQKPWRRVLEHSGIAPARIHDLRHTNASVGIAAGVGLPIVGKLLGHLSTETTKRYAHIADDPARRASEAIGLHLFNALSGQGTHATSSAAN